MRKLFANLVYITFIVGLLVSCNSIPNKDLQTYGKVNYTLEASMEELILRIAAFNQNDTNLRNAIANTVRTNPNDDYLSLFYTSWKEQNPNTNLSKVFATVELKDEVSFNSSDEEVLNVLRNLIDKEIHKTIDVISKRIEVFGVNTYSVVKAEGDMISVQLPLIEDSLRLKIIIQKTANIEFWETYKFNDPKIFNSLSSADETNVLIVGDSGIEKTNLFEYLKPNFLQDEGGSYFPGNGAIMGTALIKDTAKINAIFSNPKVRNQFPRDMKLYWGNAIPKYFIIEGKDELELFIIKVTSRMGEAPISGEYIANTSVEMSNDDIPNILINFDTKGTIIWKHLTRSNVENYIAITIDGKVYLAPMVQSEIEAGKAMVTGSYTLPEAEDLANVLKSGKLPIPIRIIKEEYIRHYNN